MKQRVVYPNNRLWKVRKSIIAARSRAYRLAVIRRAYSKRFDSEGPITEDLLRNYAARHQDVEMYKERVGQRVGLLGIRWSSDVGSYQRFGDNVRDRLSDEAKIEFDALIQS